MIDYSRFRLFASVQRLYQIICLDGQWFISFISSSFSSMLLSHYHTYTYIYARKLITRRTNINSSGVFDRWKWFNRISNENVIISSRQVEHTYICTYIASRVEAGIYVCMNISDGIETNCNRANLSWILISDMTFEKPIKKKTNQLYFEPWWNYHALNIVKQLMYFKQLHNGISTETDNSFCCGVMWHRFVY